MKGSGVFIQKRHRTWNYELRPTGGEKKCFLGMPALSWQRKGRTQVPSLAVQGPPVASGTPSQCLGQNVQRN